MRTVLVGFGRIANSIRHDKRMAKYFPRACHAQILKDHPDFNWMGVVDPTPQARAEAKEWGVLSSATTMPFQKAEFAVLAIPPKPRLEIIRSLPNLKAVLIEKPAGDEVLLKYCESHGIKVHVNFWRRGDRLYRELASGGLRKRIGRPQAVFCTYGNGLYNNGSHLVDFLKMLFGEVMRVERTTSPVPLKALGCSYPNIQDDWHVGFNLIMEGELPVSVLPIDFDKYREVSVDIWGTNGRLAFYQESLGVFCYPVKEHRAMERQNEIASDVFEILKTTQETALYNLYSNIASGEHPFSSGESALRTNRVLDSVIH